MLSSTLLANSSHVVLESSLIRVRGRHIGIWIAAAIDVCLVSILALLLLNTIEIALQSFHLMTRDFIFALHDFLEAGNDFFLCLVVRILLRFFIQTLLICHWFRHFFILSFRFLLCCYGFCCLCFLCSRSFLCNRGFFGNRFCWCCLFGCSLSLWLLNFSCFWFGNCCFFRRCDWSFLYSACIFSQWFLLDFLIGLFDVCHRWE